MSPGGLESLINVLMQLLAALVLGAGTFAIERFVRWLGLKNSAQVTAALDSALQKAVTYGLQQSHDLIREKGWDNVAVRDKALGEAANYMTDRFRDTLKAAGVDVDDTAATANAVAGALERAFPHAAAAAAASPATPPSTAPNPETNQELPDQGGAVAQVNEVRA